MATTVVGFCLKIFLDGDGEHARSSAIVASVG
jgi:hypothetical protein